MYDVIVIGAGPAGANAALDAHDSGLSVLLIDEGRDAGGQVWRVKSKSIKKAPVTDATIQGDELRERIKNSAIAVKYETRVWDIEKNGDNWRLGIQGAGEDYQLSTKSLIIATGAQERVIPVPGWTLPGVLGLAGATALFKEHMMLPGRRTIVCGTGPLVFFVASEILRLGGELAAVVTPNSKWDWFKCLPAMLRQPKLLMQGTKWILSLYLKRIPLYWQHAVAAIEGSDHVQGATLVKLDNDWRAVSGPEIYIHGESICYGQGLSPAVEATRLAGADHHYDPALGGWVPVIDAYGRTSEDGLYACGDNAGILGVLAAPLRGQFAARAVYEDLSGKSGNNLNQDELHKLAKFGRAMTSLSVPREGLIDLISAETEVCRCEGITRADVEQEISSGALSHNAVKSGTRCGMGPCGGRYCMETVAMLTGKPREEIGLPTARPPLRPVHMGKLSDELDYEELPIPGVSPL